MHKRGFVIIFVCQALAFVLTLGTAVLYRLSYMRKSHVERSFGVARLSCERLACSCAVDFLNDQEITWNGRSFIMEMEHAAQKWLITCVIAHDHKKEHENFLKLELRDEKNILRGSVAAKLVRKEKTDEWMVASAQFGPSL